MTSEVGYKRPPKEHQFKKGQVANPKGRPKKPQNLNELMAYFRDWLNEPTSKNRTRLDEMLAKMSRTKGERKALLEYAFGKVAQPVDVTSAGKSITWREFVSGEGSTD